MTSSGNHGAQSRGRITAVIVVSAVASVVPALQPLLLGGLLQAHRLNAVELGYAATVESVGMATAAAVAGLWLKPRNLRVLAASAIITAAAANLLTQSASSGGIIAARGVSGFANGVLLWMLICMLTRASQPGRLFAVYVTGQAISAFILSMLFVNYLLPEFGVRGGYGTLFALNAAILILVPWLPNSYSDVHEKEGRGVVPPLLGIVGLLGAAAQIAAITAFWVYLLPLGQQAGLSPAVTGRIVGIAIAAQIAAGLAACVLASRVQAVSVVLFSAGVGLCAVGVTGISASGTVWTGAMMIFAFFWMFAAPFHLPYLLQADPSRRAAMFVGTAQLGGMAAGPAIAALGLTGRDFSAARSFAVAAFGVTIVSALAVHFSTRARPRAEPPAIAQSLL